MSSTLADNYFELDNQVALVTGASSGLGRHFATILARVGCQVVATARRAERLQALQDEIESDTEINGSLHPYTCLLYTSPSPRDQRGSRMPSSA